MEKVGIPRTTIRLNVAMQLLAMTVLLFAANYFAFNHYVRKDFSRSQKFVLSDQTKRILREIKKVKVIVYFSPTSITPEMQIFPDVKNLLKEMVFSGKNKFEIEYVDPTRDLTRARELQAHYKFNADENVLILDYEGRVKFLPVPDMAEFDMTPVASGDPPRLISFKGEQAFANALFALISPEQLKAYFLVGHGEPSVEGPGSALSVFRDYIERQNVSTAPLSLAALDAVPSDCATLVVLGAQSDLDEREALILKKYFENKGHLLVLLDPNARTPRLYDLLHHAGIMPLDVRVLRTMRLSFATGILREVTAEFMPDNAITKRLVGSHFLFSGATQALELAPDEKDKELQLWPLVRAAEEFWGEADYVTDEKTGVRYEEGRDVGYPVYLAIAATRGGTSDGRVAVDSAKLIAVGNSEFALDVALSRNPQGVDFLVSSMNWLLNRNQFTGVMPKTVQHFPLNLTERQLSSIAFYTLFIVPGLAALMGIVAWWRRRA